MILNHKGTDVEMGGGIEGAQPVKFGIARSGAAFKVLSSRLYSDKPRAIIRELSCNAYDAHVMAGKSNIPFEIHLPTSFEPYFSIKDFGVGLSHEDMLGLMTTYFGTNKDQNNDVIGALGLGSKSPFCYVSGYTVISRFNGKTRTYDAFLDQNGEPNLRLASELDTPEVANGIEVSFPVKQDDIWEFENKAKIALEFFNPRPTLNIPLDIPQQTYTLKTEKWGMRTEKRTPQGSGLRAIQGMVPYSVGDIDISRLSESQRKISEMPLDFFFPLGALSPNASRESLELDEPTVASILSALDEVHAGLMDEVKRKIDACSLGWEARLVIHEMMMQPGMGGLVNDAFNKGMLFGTYRNFTFHGKRPVFNELDFNYTRVVYLSRNNSRRGAKKPSRTNLFTSKPRVDLLKQVREGEKKVEDFEYRVEIGRSVAFVINDLNKKGEKYVNYYVQEAEDREYNTVYLINRANPKVKMDDMLDDITTLLAKLGNPPLLKASDLKAKYASIVDVPKEKVARERREVIVLRSYVRSTYRRRWNSPNRTGWKNAWDKATEEQVSAEGKKYYVVVDRYLSATNAPYDDAHDFRAFVDHTVKVSSLLGLPDTLEVFGIKETSGLRNDPEWVEFIPYVLTKAAEYMTPARQLQFSLVTHEFDCDFESVLNSIFESGTLPEYSPMYKFISSLRSARAGVRFSSESMQKVLRVAESKGFYTPVPVLNFNEVWDKVTEIYPMFEICRRNYRNDRSIEYRAVADYINMVDERSKFAPVDGLQINLNELEGELVNV